MSKTTVVIGAGIGGLNAGIRLARGGYRVRCFEQHSAPGDGARAEARAAAHKELL